MGHAGHTPGTPWVCPFRSRVHEVETPPLSSQNPNCRRLVVSGHNPVRPLGLLAETGPCHVSRIGGSWVRRHSVSEGKEKTIQFGIGESWNTRPRRDLSAHRSVLGRDPEKKTFMDVVGDLPPSFDSRTQVSTRYLTMFSRCL